MFVSMKSLAVMQIVPLRQVGGNTGKSRAAQKKFEAGQLVLAAPHAGFQQVADKGRHAQALLGGLDAEPIGDILAQSDGDVFHDTDIVEHGSCVKKRNLMRQPGRRRLRP